VSSEKLWQALVVLEGKWTGCQGNGQERRTTLGPSTLEALEIPIAEEVARAAIWILEMAEMTPNRQFQVKFALRLWGADEPLTKEPENGKEAGRKTH
jgi:hypothetical protein